MKSIDEAEARARFDEVLEEAQRQSVVIRRRGKEIAILLSMAEHERLRGDTIRRFLDLHKLG